MTHRRNDTNQTGFGLLLIPAIIKLARLHASDLRERTKLALAKINGKLPAKQTKPGKCYELIFRWF